MPAAEQTGRSRVEPRPFGPGSLLWDLVGQRLFQATSADAFILQVMHPAIGCVVDQRSSFRTDPWGRAARSFESVLIWVYGGPEALEEGRRLRRIHRPLQATDQDGRTHRALSAEPWAWVPLTAYHAISATSRYFMPRPLGEEQLEQIYGEILQLCRILQVPERMLPPTTAAYWDYFDSMVARTLVDHPVAHEALGLLAHAPPPPGLPAVLAPGWRPLRRAVAATDHVVTVGLLPPAARRKLGLRWTRLDELELRAAGVAVGRLNDGLPERARYVPAAYRARQAAGVGI